MLKPLSPLAAYLGPSAWIDSDHPAVAAKAAELAAGRDTDAAVAEAAFVFVRDAIRHSVDHRQNPVTRAASEVLAHGTGYCYAKAHLLAALLRANGIPAGLCYQRLLLDPDKDAARYCLHGLVAARLKDRNWYRIDPRGNKPGVDARFTPPTERLAFPITAPGEADLPGIHAAPLPMIMEALTRHGTWDALYDALPDVSS
ncbi:transglutaminase domain protein [Solidesulfovibrio fructosivorans JJ]]|uniref:Transglutaminase domain protein n=1 Tax=Solidesulfovibrio fructosivorans JJ] TaxID=596151 RepID=E1K2K1_SOLFR|nr:transglutaminase domain-containing protein [Solidesulfovibrio fructosivorans]EFL49166.1 transglutaminase domain protein [Solidesulfovibrio fructosivorans JJ]]